ncbi:MAG: sulfocyanin-like copper-binding protein [Actinomycetota bacterium]
MLRNAPIALGAVAMITLAACSGGSTPAPAPAPAETSAAPAPSEAEPHSAPVAATEADFSITLDSSDLVAGETTFNVTNDGPSTHEFVILETDAAPDALPVKDGIVDEGDPSIKANLGEVEDVTAGSSKDLTAALEAGKYVVICNLPGHYEAGMYAGITAS